MKIILARHYGMCFGVRDALRRAHKAADNSPVTVLGKLVHNPVVQEHLRSLGIAEGTLDDTGSSRTRDVLITAHGASDKARAAWQEKGHRVLDTTCPLVRKAHAALAALVEEGCLPVVIGQPGHAEVRGLTGDFPEACVLESAAGLAALPYAPRYGVISQTTQPLAHVRGLVAALQASRPGATVVFRDTVCQPTKDRQTALTALCAQVEAVVVVGGRFSNNTRQLTATIESMGVRAIQVERPEELEPRWFSGTATTGVTAGTSTPDESVRDVVQRLGEIARELAEGNVFQRLTEMAVKAMA